MNRPQALSISGSSENESTAVAREAALGDSGQGPSQDGRFATIRGYAELGRPANAVGLASFTLVGAYVGGGESVLSPAAAASAVVTLLAVFGGYAINDYFDREVDRINDPDRPIPRGAVPPVGALALALVTFGLAGLVTTLVLPPLAGVLVVLNLSALVVYTPRMKGLFGFGNLVISALVGSAALLGGIAVGNAEPVVVMSLLAFQMLLGLEIIKDLEDVDGDARAGLQTLPVALGRSRAVRLTLVVLFATVPLSLVPYLRGTFGLAYLSVILVAHVLTGATMWATVASPPSRALKWIKAAMLVCMAAFVAGRAF